MDHCRLAEKIHELHELRRVLLESRGPVRVIEHRIEILECEIAPHMHHHTPVVTSIELVQGKAI